jgi:hypothetical protein
MSKFNKNLLSEIKDKLYSKNAFIPSPQMQEQIVQAQQEGVVPPPDPNAGANGEAPRMGFDELAQLVQEGFQAIIQGQQQLAQMIQQQAAMAAAGGGEKGKKLSTNDRITRLEEMLQQAMGGAPAPEGAAPPEQGAPVDPAAQGAPVQ